MVSWVSKVKDAAMCGICRHRCILSAVTVLVYRFGVCACSLVLCLLVPHRHGGEDRVLRAVLCWDGKGEEDLPQELSLRKTRESCHDAFERSNISVTYLVQQQSF